MHKLDDIKWANSSHYGISYGPESTYRRGWDDVMALNLPVKFEEWKIANQIKFINLAGNINCYSIKGVKFFGMSTPKDLYEHWINNVFPTGCCKGIQRIGESCNKNNNCTFPKCLSDE